MPRIEDYNGASQEGASIFQQNVSGGLRYSSSVGYLDDHGLPNLTVWTGAQVQRVVIEGNRAVGVEVITASGRETIRAAREVILSAGAFGSPQLLMLSGVGPAAHLREHGIDVVADLPVGENLHDHMFVPMTYVMKTARNRGTTPYFAAGVMKEAIRGGTWMGRTVFEAAGFVRSSQADADPRHPAPGAAVVLPVPEPGRAHQAQGRQAAALTIMTTLIYPQSRGTLRLASADPAAAPLIDPGYLTEAADTEVLLDGMELVRAVMSNKVIAGDVDLELSPGRDYRDRAALAREVPNRATSVYHPVGTCRMGVDERAVVDPDAAGARR